MLRWQPGAILLSEFDIKIGRLSASARRKTLTESDVANACDNADDAIRRMMRKDHNDKRSTYRRGAD
ncbi:hypothetical protein B2M27_24090 [Kluyvera intermedia]|uniref:Uncharacterized protein n=1 Tax=Kluyvera intermedia TaxID=61648 RepID=A0ABX3UA14_KLUIN|nr:hypothetical protein [Kluyvera intermedia]ORJ47835.1 hypothetical protein B2M27_24090 [Kluyvera intermedia]